MSVLKEALQNAIGESIGSDAAEVQLSVASVDEALACLKNYFHVDTVRRLRDSTCEVQGSEDGVSWNLLLKGKP